jgi:hypothetical protein
MILSNEIDEDSILSITTKNNNLEFNVKWKKELHS